MRSPVQGWGRGYAPGVGQNVHQRLHVPPPLMGSQPQFINE